MSNAHIYMRDTRHSSTTGSQSVGAAALCSMLLKKQVHRSRAE